MIIVQYALLTLITVLFSVFSISVEKAVQKVILSAVSWMLWFALGAINLGVSAIGSVMQVSLSVLFFGLGGLWMILSLYYTLELVRFNGEQRSRVDLV